MRVWLVLLGCSTRAETGLDTEGPVDSDVGGFFVLGTVHLERADADVVTCDETYDLLATGPYVGDCPGCVFAFDLEPQVDPLACTLDNDETWLGLWPDPSLGGRWVGWAPDRREEQGTSVLGYVDVLMVGGDAGWRPFAGTSGYWVDDALVYTYPYGPGTVAEDGDTLLFDVTLEREVTAPRYGRPCGPDEGDPIAALPSPDVTAEGALADTSKIDVWTAEVTAAGQVGAAVTSTSVSWLQVIGPDGCFLAAGRYPGRVFFADAGTLTFVVGLGAADTYTLALAGAVAAPVLAHDEVEPWDTRTVRTAISGALDRTSPRTRGPRPP